MGQGTVLAGRRPISACLFFAACVWAAPAFAAVIFTFQQTAASITGLVVNAALTTNGDLGDLPTLDSSSAASPIDFGNLLALDIVSPIGHFSLSDFRPACHDPFSCLSGFASWSISPSGISFIDALGANSFLINGLGTNSTVQVDTDASVTLPECRNTGSCVVTGDWIALSVAEPSGLMLLTTSLFLAGLGLRWRRE